MVITRRQIELETFLLISIVVVGSLYFAIQKNNHQPQFSFASGISPVSAPAEIISPKITVAQQISPDGEKKVIMKVTENSDNTKTHDLSTADENGANEKFVFTKILDSSKNMSIPFNTWSPDDNYFFIQENAGENKSIFVFKATGESFSDTEKYFDAADIFTQKDTGNNFAEATGWASGTLIIINTTKPDDTKGFSYWFEVPSKAIIQLSTEF